MLADGLLNATAKETTMPQIGTFIREENGFIGHLTTLLLTQDVIIVDAEPSETENAPSYRVHIFNSMNNETGAEIGAGWNRIGEKAGAYISLQIDCPSLPQPIHANLFQSNSKDGLHHLLWNRLQRRDERG